MPTLQSEYITIPETFARLFSRRIWEHAKILISVFVLKAIALGLAVSAMVVNMTLAGTPESAGIAIPFIVITVLNLLAVVSLWKNFQE